MKRYVILLFSLMLAEVSYAQQHITSCLPPGENPFSPMNIFIIGATYQGQQLSAGDEVGVFGSSVPTICAGAAPFSSPVSAGNPLQIIATRNDGSGCGFNQGDNIVFKIWVQSQSTIFTVAANEIEFFDPGTGTSLGSSVVPFNSMETAAVKLTVGTPSYTLTTGINPVGGGTVNPPLGSHNYIAGTLVNLSATPATGYQFANWTGDVANASNATTTVTMNGNKSVTANFTLIQHTLTLSVSPTQGGSTIPAAGSYSYSYGTVVTVRANPYAGYQFVNWSGDVANATSENTTVTINANKNVVANFAPVQYTLTLAANPALGGTTNPSVGSYSYNNGTVVTIQATASSGFQFINWTGDVANPSGSTTTVTLNGHKTVTANFSAVQTTYMLTIGANPAQGGTTNPVVGNHTYTNGAVVSIQATAAAGYQFVNWNGDVTNPANATTTVTVNNNKVVTANFTPIQYTLTLGVNPSGSGTTNPSTGSHSYNSAAVVTVQATAGSGYQFSHWTGDVANPNSSTTNISMNANKAVTANFTATSGNTNQWSDQINISSGSVPDLDIDPSNGNLHIVALTNNIVYTMTDASGAVLVQENVPGTSGVPGESAFGPTVAVDNHGYPHVCYRTYNNNNLYSIYYIYKNASGWSSPLLVSDKVNRGYMVRMDIDSQNRVHIVRGSATGEDVVGPVKYYRIVNGSVDRSKDNMTTYRADDRVEIDASSGNELHILLGCPNPGGSPVTYWRSTNSGESIASVGDIHDNSAVDRNGSPDVFVDESGNVHVCYGAAIDTDINRKPSVRYSRWQNGNRVRDLTATKEGDCTAWKQDQGIASIAASSDGQVVIIAFVQTDGGSLHTIMSTNGGGSWSNKEFIAANCGGAESRNKQVLRARGNKFYLVYPTSGIKLRILTTGASADQWPAADAGGPYSGQVGNPVTFNGTGSSDDVGITQYSWDFGDGQSGTGVTVAHAYASDNVYTVTLRVTDTSGQTDTDQTTVVIGNASGNEWNDPIYISSGDTPDFDIHQPTGNLHLAVMKNGVTYIELDRYGTLLREERVPGAEDDRGMINFGASIAVDSQGYPHIGYRVSRGNNRYDLYYVYKNAQGWSSPLKIGDLVLRGYVVRLAADASDRVYYCHSSVTNTTTNTGPVHMYIIQNGSIVLHQSNIDQTRGDERYEFDVSENGLVDLAAGDLSYPNAGGPIYYWRSGSAGQELEYKGDYHDSNSRGGVNGSPDVFVDESNNTHVCYGAEIDIGIDRLPSLRYLRILNGTKVRDVRVTRKDELTSWKFGMGIGSIAASADGQTVIAAYLKTENSELRTRLSSDGGATWGDALVHSNGWDCAEGRNKQIIRARGNVFYMIYPENGIQLKIFGTPPSTQPRLVVIPNALNFENTSNQLTLLVKNNGGGTMNWSIPNIPVAWIQSILPRNGVLGTSQSVQVTITIDRTGLADGDYNTSLAILSNGGDGNVPIQMEVGGQVAWFINCGGPGYTDPEGTIWRADQAYTVGSFGYDGGDAYKTTSAIDNTEADPLFQSERYNMSAYRFDVPNGEYALTLHFAEIYHLAAGKRVFNVALEGVPIMNSFDIFLEAGHNAALSYNFNMRDLGIRVNDNRLDITFTNIKDVAKVSAIRLQKLAALGPVLSTTPAALNFGTDASVLPLTVRNAGEGTLSWNLGSYSTSWIQSVQPTSGNLNSGQSANLTVIVSRTGLAPGNYASNLPFTSNAGDVNVSVSMEVPTSGSALIVWPTLLDFGYYKQTMDFNVANAGNLTLNWNVSAIDRPEWVVSIVPDEGAIAPGDTIQTAITINRSNLPDGIHMGILHFISDGGNADVAISVHAGAPSAWRINCGGPAYTDTQGHEWSADQAYEGNGFGFMGGDTFSTTDPISGTDDDPLYQSERFGLQGYRFDVPNGDYRISLHFAEIFYTIANERKMHVKIEGDPAISFFDIFADAGHDAAYVDVFNTAELGMTVTDNRIDIDFVPLKDQPKISAIEIETIVTPGPVLSLNPSTVNFGNTAVHDTVTITNTGVGTLNWQAGSHSIGWLSGIQPMNGALAPAASQQVVISIDRTGLNNGSYTGTLPITSNGGNLNLTLNMQVLTIAPVISVSPGSLIYFNFMNQLTLTVSNVGNGPMNWQISTVNRPNWVNMILPESGSLAANASVDVSVSVNRTGLSNGTYTGSLTIQSNGGNMTVPVELQVGSSIGWRINCGGPAYKDVSGEDWSADQPYTAGSFGYVGGNTYSTIHAIVGTDDDVLYQSERYEMSAYRFDVPNGDYNVTLHFAEIFYTVSRRRIMEVKLEGTTVLPQFDIYLKSGHDKAYVQSFSTRDLGLTVSDNRIDIEFLAIKDQPKISAIEVEPIIPAGPALSINPVSLNFGRVATRDTLRITNSGESILNWQLGTVTANWVVNIQPQVGNLSAGASQNVIVTIARTGLNQGAFSTNLPFISNAGNQNVQVNMEVRLPGAEMTVTPDSLDFAYFTDVKSFTIRNIGELSLNWSISGIGLPSWIASIVPMSGAVSAGGSASVIVTINRTGLSYGAHSGQIPVTSNGGNVTIHLRMISGGLRINCGGPNYTAASGEKWEADQSYRSGEFGYTGGNVYQTSDPISGTEIDPIYQTEHYGMSSYRIDVPNRDYLVTLHFAEIYYTSTKRRVMSVSLEGTPIISNMDIFSRAGHDAALALPFSTKTLGLTIRDGRIDLDFSSTVDVPKISGIEIEVAQPVGPRLAVNPTELDFMNTSTSMKATLSNIGDASFSWSINTSGSASWRSGVSPTSGTLIPGSSQEVTVTVNRAGLPDGNYQDVLHVISAGGNQDVMLRMTVGGPRVWRVNCGGATYTDNQSRIWAADQAYVDGGLGYVGGTPYATKDPIANTSSDPLYQTERFGMTAYRFTVPNGYFIISLHFAEIYHQVGGRRVFSVELEGINIVQGLDIFKRVGHDNPLVLTFNTKTMNIPVNDGRLDLTFTPTKDQPKISAIEVEFVPTFGTAGSTEILDRNAVLLPTEYKLWQNYPNPFNSSTIFRYDVPRESNVRLEIYNLLGQRVRTLLDEPKSAGNHQILWDGRDDVGVAVPSGVYLCQFRSDGYEKSVKIMFMK